MGTVYGYSPTTGDANYSTFNNPAVQLANAGFVDLGVKTSPVPAYNYPGGEPIYGGVVSADGSTITQPTPAPDADAIQRLSSLNARTPRVASAWGIAEIRAWAQANPGATIYAVFH